MSCIFLQRRRPLGEGGFGLFSPELLSMVEVFLVHQGTSSLIRFLDKLIALLPQPLDFGQEDFGFSIPQHPTTLNFFGQRRQALGGEVRHS